MRVFAASIVDIDKVLRKKTLIDSCDKLSL
jgi:hypothetical protein